MFVRTWMSAPAVVIPPVVPADAALEFMKIREIRRLPVVEEMKLLGIITRSDLEAALGKPHKPGEINYMTVSDIMTARPITVDPDDTLEKAAQLMLDNKVSGLPVTREKEIVGIITESDIFRALSEILGIKQRGARVVMTVDKDDDLLESIRKQISGLALHSLTTWRNPNGGKWEVVLRVRGYDTKATSRRPAEKVAR